ncbi:MAG: transcription elongation factor GreA [Candidatus Paceibacterota bacterium]
MDTFYLSKKRFDALEKELEELKSKGRYEVAEKLKSAKDLGDLSENFEYQEAKKEKDQLEQKINRIESIVRNAEIIKKPSKTDVVTVGSKVTIKRDGKSVTYTIVGSNETDPEQGYISNESPIGTNLLGKRKGDEFEIKTPKGKVSCKITKIE